MLPDHLKSLAAELDALAGVSPGPGALDGLPDLGGTDFEPIAELGRGGMGVVYEARQISLDRVVAVKLLSPHYADDASFRERFVAESRLVARLHHPHIVDVYAAGTHDGKCYFAMERVEGRTAKDHVFTSLGEVLSYGIQIADALAYAHGCGVIHRDVKPANVFVGTTGVAKLGDFGLACLAGAETDASGTHRYMAPELVAGGNATPASDQYALGATLLELTEPFPETRRNPDLAAVLAKATKTDPADRYPDTAAFAEDLRRVVAHEPVLARSASTFRQLQLWSRRNPSAFWGIVVAGVCLVGFVVALVYGYVNTRHALAVAERSRAETQQALRQVEAEAGQAALSLANTLTAIDRTSGDMRADEINRAIATAETLARRFPDNADVKSALEKLRHASEAHARFIERRGPRFRRPPPRR